MRRPPSKLPDGRVLHWVGPKPGNPRDKDGNLLFNYRYRHPQKLTPPDSVAQESDQGDFDL